MQELLTERSGLCCLLTCWIPIKMLELQDKGFLDSHTSPPSSPPCYAHVTVTPACLLKHLCLVIDPFEVSIALEAQPMVVLFVCL